MVGKHWQSVRLVASHDQGEAFDDDLHRERRKDHHEHGGLAIPQGPNDDAFEHDADRGYHEHREEPRER
jgi:hypothetical protein